MSGFNKIIISYFVCGLLQENNDELLNKNSKHLFNDIKAIKFRRILFFYFHVNELCSAFVYVTFIYFKNLFLRFYQRG